MGASIRKVAKAPVRGKKVVKKAKNKKPSLWSRWLHGSK